MITMQTIETCSSTIYVKACELYFLHYYHQSIGSSEVSHSPGLSIHPYVECQHSAGCPSFRWVRRHPSSGTQLHHLHSNPHLAETSSRLQHPHTAQSKNRWSSPFCQWPCSCPEDCLLWPGQCTCFCSRPVLQTMFLVHCEWECSRGYTTWKGSNLLEEKRELNNNLWVHDVAMK